MRALEASGRAPGGRWPVVELERAFRRRCHRRWYQHARRRFGEFLQSVGRLTPQRETGPHASLLARYQRYLSEVRGLAPATITQHLAEVGGLLRSALPQGQSLTPLTTARIEQHWKRRARCVSRGFLQTGIGYVRTFLRYGFEQRLLPNRLDALDRPVGFRAEQPPRALDWPLLQRFLRSIPRTGRTGWRDFMLLHLMAHCGLRTAEIARLTVDAIDWSARSLLVEQFKTHSWLALPLMDQTLELLRRCLRDGRRASQRHELFLCAGAPSRPMTKGAVSQAFKDRARQSGLPIAHASAHALRHSSAMRLFARGVGIKAIGDLMGHHGLASTAVYLRLQTEGLREDALPVARRSRSEGGAA
ncbi:MAG: tyrosine-type recombinase/integrase [Verrucomicrobia bacterium]|nr:tyrosine-type recombinase/integrase [Verrucomicrobiota bacterium]